MKSATTDALVILLGAAAIVALARQAALESRPVYARGSSDAMYTSVSFDVIGPPNSQYADCDFDVIGSQYTDCDFDVIGPPTVEVVVLDTAVAGRWYPGKRLFRFFGRRRCWRLSLW